MKAKIMLGAAVAANLVFWPALLIFAALRPDYSHFTDAVSELGVWGAPRMWAWNIVGFMIPFWLAALAGWGIGRTVAPTGWVLPSLLAAGGVLGGMAGLFPANMEDRSGFWTTAHLAVSQGGLLIWLPGMLMLGLRVTGPSRGLAIAAWLCLAAMVASIILTYQPNHPGMTQRVVFAGFLGSHLVLAIVAFLQSRRLQNVMAGSPSP
jgi:hypothetical membrane protein